MSLTDRRQAHNEGAAPTFFAVDLDSTTVLLYDLLDQRQPQPHTAKEVRPHLPDPVKSLEDAVQLISRNQTTNELRSPLIHFPAGGKA